MKPDFSGEYELNRGASALNAAVAASIQSASMRIKHDEPNFSCQGRFLFLKGEAIQWAFELPTDGPDIAQTERERPTGSSIRWVGSALVFISLNQGTMNTFRYELDGEGRLRIAEQLRGTDHDQDNLWIFDRR